MSEKELVGQIKINFVKGERPEVVIVGEVRPRAVPGLTRAIQVAYRKYRQDLVRSKPRVDMSDKGAVQEESQLPVPNPAAAENLFDKTPTKPPEVEEMVVEDALAEEEAPEVEDVKVEDKVEDKKSPYAVD